MISREVALRVLYTINTSPQYILAKAPHGVSVVTSGTTNGTAVSDGVPLHASVSLKICANTICRSSPELRPDYAKDYSLYVLDPLEDIRSNPSMGQRTESSGGVAVGMGLMSEVLSSGSDDSIMVTGTLVSSGKDDYALEVVFSLRQVARAPEYPPVFPYTIQPSQALHPLHRNAFGQGYSNSTPSTSKRVDNHSLFTSQPLPSFSDRLIQKYATGGVPLIPEMPKIEDPAKLNPARLTRAALFPTPYIGPPKKSRQKKRSQFDSSEAQMSEGERSSLDEISTGVQNQPNLQQINMGASVGNPFESSSASSSTRHPSSGSAAGLSQAGNANILAALSSISSSIPGSGDTPNPELVNFLKAYLVALETSRSSSTATNPLNTQAVQTSPPSQRNLAHSSDLKDKENCNPRKTKIVNTTPTKQRGQPVKVTSPNPLISKNVNARESKSLNPPPGSTSVQSGTTMSDENSDTGVVEILSGLQEGSSKNKKRKASEAELSGEPGKGKGRSVVGESMLIGDHVLPRVNTGWGGLRLRQDGNFGGRLTTTAAEGSTQKAVPLQPPPLFRSTSVANVAPTRKGKYVVPEWARNVPPPPPKRIEDSEQEINPKAKTQQGKSKPSRLGGKTALRRTVTCPRTPRKDNAETNSFSRSLSMISRGVVGKSNESQSSSQDPGLPVFAQSSPVAKKSGNAFFQAFNTSPIRPTQSVSQSKGTQPSSPTTPTNRVSPPTRVPKRSSASFDSLFTPSPRHKHYGQSNPPLSPSPSRRTKLVSISPKRSENSAGQDADMDDEAEMPVLCSLPIASSDDIASDEPILIHSDSSEKIHDWSSFDLPPSSPPPLSSPMLEPIDIDGPVQSNCEMATPSTPSEGTLEDFTETPSTDAAFDCFSEDFLVQLSSSFEGSTDSGDSGSMTTTLFAEHSIDSAYMALENGLGGEDLSEAWSLLGDVVGPVEGSARGWTDLGQGFDETASSWFGSENSSVFGSQQETSSSLSMIDEAASHFEALLKGCLV